jgi:hypothetical protein
MQEMKKMNLIGEKWIKEKRLSFIGENSYFDILMGK